MRLNKISNINFVGKIIDSHVHTGNWRRNDGSLYNAAKDFDVFIKTTLDNGDEIEKVIVSNLDCMVHKDSTNGAIEFLSNEFDGNKKMLLLAEKNSKIGVLATCQPGYGNVDNIKKLYSQNPNNIIGLKFHPEQLEIAADSNVYDSYMQFAKEKKLPCLFHCGNTFDVKYPDGGISKATKYSKPEQIYSLARRYKDVPVVMAHWGGDGAENYEKMTDIIIQSIKNKDAKLYGDISWVDCNNSQKPNLKKIIERLKAENALDRILFGTDAPLARFGGEGENGISAKQAYQDNIKDIKSMIKREFPDDAEKIIDKIFYENANNLFFKKNNAGTINVKPKGIKKTTIALVAAGVTFLGVVTAAYIHEKKAKEANNNHLSAVI